MPTTAHLKTNGAYSPMPPVKVKVGGAYVAADAVKVKGAGTYVPLVPPTPVVSGFSNGFSNGFGA